MEQTIAFLREGVAQCSCCQTPGCEKVMEIIPIQFNEFSIEKISRSSSNRTSEEFRDYCSPESIASE